MAGPTVSAGYAQAIVTYAASRGADRARLLARSGLSDADLADQDDRVPLERYLSLIQAARALCNAPAFALEFSEGSRFEAFSIVGLICQAAETMGEALRQLNRYQRLVTEAGGVSAGDRFKLTREQGRVWLVDQRPNPGHWPELTELAFSRFICEVARHFGSTPFVKGIEVAYPRPAHAEAYARILKAPVTFGAGRNAMLIEESWLSLPTHAPNRYVFNIFNDRADALLDRLAMSESVSGQVESFLTPRLHLGGVGMAAAARHLNLSRQSLYRRLKAEGRSFEGLVDGLRRELATGYLESGRLSVNETAYLLGFSDASAFSRAYKRWTGTSPRKRGAV